MDRKTLAWSRCDVCGRHGPVRECRLKPGLMVCPWCCLSCPLRSKCDRPAWFPGLRGVERKQSQGKRSRSILSYLED